MKTRSFQKSTIYESVCFEYRDIHFGGKFWGKMVGRLFSRPGGTILRGSSLFLTLLYYNTIVPLGKWEFFGLLVQTRFV